MKKHQVLRWTLRLATGLWALTSLAQVPQLINYQGRLVQGTNLFSGSAGLSLRLYNAPAGGAPLYEDSNSVAVVDGLYSTFIGDNPANSSFLIALTNSAVWVEVAVNGTVLSPRERLASVAYALAVRGLLVGTAGAPNIILGSAQNAISNGISGASILGGSNNAISLSSDYSSIGGGLQNVIRGSSHATIAGGSDNRIVGDGLTGNYSAIGGGVDNLVWGLRGFGSVIFGGANTIAGGHGNTIATNSDWSSIGGGQSHIIQTNADYATIGGGYGNTIAADSAFATIPGGDRNTATHRAFAAGRRAKADHTGSFVWSDSQDADFGSSVTNQFLIRASGGVGINTTNNQGMLHVFRGEAGANAPSADSIAVFENSTHGYLALVTPTNTESGILFGDGNNATKGAVLFQNAFGITNGLVFRTGNNTTRMVIDANGFVGIGTTAPTNRLHVAGAVQATSFITSSDRNMKENVAPVSVEEILEKVAALPIATWNFKGQADGMHLGPMAQDFKTAFNLGNTETGIATVDADGVSFASIQALYRIVQEQQKRIEELEKKLAERQR